MVLHIQPVADLHAIAIYRKLLVVFHIVDHKRDQFFRELVRAIVVTTSCDVDGHPVCIMESLHEMVSRCL